MKKLRYVVLLLALACVSFAFSGVIGCKQQLPQVTISGFELTETSTTVDAGDVVFVNTVAQDMQVTGSDGKAYEVYYDVTTKNGGYVDVSRGFFFADDTAGYVITYKVITSDNKVHTLTQDVNVVGQLTLRADYETRLYSVGDEITVVPVCNYADPVYTITVTYNDTPVAISADYKFTAENIGWYTINIHAEATNATPADFEYTVYARAAFQEGEVETFDESWEIVRQLENYKTHGWVVKSTEELGIKDRFGEDATLLAGTTQAQSGYSQNGVGYYFSFWLNARENREYYKSLAEQGYSHVSIWAYLDVEIPCREDCKHIVSRVRGGTEANAPGLGSTANIMGTETLYNDKWDGQWMEFKVRLVDLTTHNDYLGSFNTSFDYYKYEWYPFIRFESSNWRNHGKMNVYIDDIYVVKEVPLAFNEDTKIDAEVGDTVDFSQYVDLSAVPADANVVYSVSANNEGFVALDGSSYTIPEIGAYTVKVAISNPCYIGSATYTFVAPKAVNKGTVLVDTEKLVDTYDLTSMLTADELEKIEGFGTLAYEMTDVKGNKTVLTDTEIDLSSITEGFYDFVGYYGTAKVPVWTARVDFYSGNEFVWRNPQASDITNNDVYLLNGWAGEFKGTGGALSVVDIAQETYNTDSSKTGNYYRFDYNNGDFKSVGIDRAWGIKVNPVHSKEYYQMFAGNSNVKLEFDYMFVKTGADATDSLWVFKYGYSLGKASDANYKTWEGIAHSTWNTGWVDLDYFLANRWDVAYDTIKGGSMLAMNNTAFLPNNSAEEYSGDFVVYMGNFRVANASASYVNEYYLYNAETGDYELDESLSETVSADFGATVNFNQKAIEGYAFNAEYAGNVLSGTTEFGKTTVLKGYYVPSIEYNLNPVDGFFKADSINLADYVDGEIARVAVSQYVVTSEDNVSIDVTAKYSSLVNTAEKTVDTSSLDGIFTFSIFGVDSSVVNINFERAIDGVFMWNNIDESASSVVKGVRLGGRYVYEEYAGAGSVTAVASTDSIVAGKAGNFYRLDTSTDTHSGSKWGVSIYPAHSKEYYEAILVDGNVNIAMDWYFTKTGENPTTASWTFFEGQGLGREDEDNIGPWNGHNITYDQSADTWNSVGSGWNQRHWISLAHVVKHWSNAINTTGGGGFLSFSQYYSSSEDYTGTYSVYFGNIHALTGYNTEYYTQQDDGSFTLATTVSKMADAGTTVNAKLDYAIENYTYAQHEDEVLSGTVANTIKYVTLKVYYVKSNIAYTVEHYVWSDTANDYELADSETLYGTYNTTVEVTPKTTYENAAYTVIDGKSVESGTLTLDGSLVLKAYYAKATKVTLADADGFYRANSIDLSEYVAGNVESIKIDQYVVTNEGNVAVDVTDAYSTTLDAENKAIDLTAFDGIYTIVVKDDNGAIASFDFERVIDGVFNWNNIDESGKATVASAAVVHGYDSSNYEGDGVIESVDANDPIIAGRAGNYWKMTQTYSSEKANWGLKVYPAHNKAYYEALGELSVYVDYYFVKDSTGSTAGWNLYHHSTAEGSSGNVVMDYPIIWNQKAGEWGTEGTEWNQRQPISLAGLVARWDGVTDVDQGGGLFGFWNTYDTETLTGKFTVYFGNVHTTTGYNTEYYTQQDDGSFTLAKTVSTKATAGDTVNANITYAIENYTYAQHADEVLTGTVTNSINYVTLKVYYVKSNVPYTVEHYVWSDTANDYELADSETLYGTYDATVEVTPKTTYENATYTVIDGKSVESGKIALDGSLVLKAYYAKASTYNLADADGFYRADSLNLGDYLTGDIESVEVTQYVVKASGNVGVDVTDAYVSTVNTEAKTVDLTAFDGIYTVETKDSNGSIAIFNFERVVEGVFTWNNLNEAGKDTVVGAGHSGIWADKSEWYHNLTPQNVAVDDPVLAGRSGAYYKVSGSAEEINEFAGKIYPTHTKAYYEALLEDGEVYYSMDLNFVGASNSYNILFSYGAGYNSAAAPDGTTDYCQYGQAYQYSGYNSFADEKFNRYGGRVARKLSGIVDNWDSYMQNGTGGYLFGVRKIEGDTSSSVTAYFGNVHLVNVYTTEYYTQQADGTYLDTPALTVNTYSEYATGTTVTANTTKVIEGYVYAQNPNEVASTTLGVNVSTLKVYYVSSNVAYDVEVYTYNASTTSYEKSEEYSYTAYGAAGSTAKVSETLVVDGYVLDTSIEGTVASGVISLTEKLVLKAYYLPATENTITGLRNAATLDLGVGEVVSYSITQYVVTTTNATRGEGSLGAAATLGTTNYTGVDVTANHPDIITNGVLDTSKLDGIYKVTAKGATGIAVHKFEQYVADTFTWNNIVENAEDTADTASVKLIGAYSWHNSWKPYNTASVEVITAENNADLATRMAGAYQGSNLEDTTGLYWKTTLKGGKGGDSDGTGVRIMPVHTLDYYTTLWNGATVTYNAMAGDTNKGATQYMDCQFATAGYIDDGDSGYNMYSGSVWGNYWRTASFEMNENTFVALSCTNYNHYETFTRAGSFASYWGKGTGLTTNGNVVFWIGGFTATPATPAE
ncbi:MAG: hypothetical protein IJZ73_00710 [Clostridia bacterium]|nr:hypothetical protein [Clostridia bacterium]